MPARWRIILRRIQGAYPHGEILHVDGVIDGVQQRRRRLLSEVLRRPVGKPSRGDDPGRTLALHSHSQPSISRAHSVQHASFFLPNSRRLIHEPRKNQQPRIPETKIMHPQSICPEKLLSPKSTVSRKAAGVRCVAMGVHWSGGARMLWRDSATACRRRAHLKQTTKGSLQL